MTDRLFAVADTVRVSLGALAGAHDCTPSGIAGRCHGGCCYDRGGVYWPARIDPGDDGACAALGPDGCTLGDDRPVTCHLYPLHESRGVIGLHFRTRLATSCCAGNAGIGPPLHVAIRGSLERLLAPGEYDRIVDAIKSGVRGGFDVIAGPDTVARLAEDRLAAEGNRWPDYVPNPPTRC